MEQKQPYLSPDLAHRLAAIDIGTNSIRLIIAEGLRDRNYRVLDEEKETARLGKQLGSTGRLDPSAVQCTLETLKRMKQIADGFQVRELRVIATCAVREASDGPEFCRRVKAETGLDVEVISAKTESHLAFLSVSRSFNLQGKNVAVVDIGGGSTEIVLASGNVVEAVCTTPLGAVRLSEIYGQDQAVVGEEFEHLVEKIDRVLRHHVQKPVLVPHVIIGSGGTFTSLAEMIAAAKGQVGLPLRGYEFTRAEVSHMLDQLRNMSPKVRRNVAGLSADRADIIVAGVAIVDRIMQHFKLNRAQVHDRGVRDGLLLTMLDQSLGPCGDDPHDQDAAIDRLAVNCGVDPAHARQVARLADQIFAQLVKPFNLRAGDRRLLQAAARLQDVGYLINYEDHHKHSYHLILNSRLAGFKPGELELIANVARYHRGAKPKQKHANFNQLSAKGQDRVCKLAAILRLAGGLDRSNSRQVRDVSIAAANGKVAMHVVADQNPEVDIWAARRRAGLFEDAFGTTLAIRWQNPHPAQSAASGQEPAG